MFSFLFAGASCCISETEKLWKQRCVTENGELLSSACLKLQFERNALFLFKLPYCFGEFISYRIPQDWMSCSRLQAGNSLVLCANDSPSMTTGCWGLLKFLLQPGCCARDIFHFFLFLPHYFHLPTTVRAHTEHVGTLPWILPHTNMSTLSTFHRHSLLENQGNPHWDFVKFPTARAQQTHGKRELRQSQSRYFLLKNFR